MSNDYIIRGTAANEQVRFFAATTKELVEQARQYHNTAPICTAALGRSLTAAAMMGAMSKGEKDLTTIQIKGDGPIGGITVTSDSLSRVKGYVNNTEVILPPNEAGHLNVGGAVGKGYIRVIKDMGLKEPYVGEANLISGEIAEDLTVYFAVSEQIPSAVALGVLMNKDNTVRQAGGFIIQVMPFAEEEVIDQLEKKLSQVTAITELLDEGMSPEEFIEFIMQGMEPRVMEKHECCYYCNCSRERVSAAVASISKADLQELIDDGKEIEVNCHFCDKKYIFSPEALKAMRDSK